MNKKILWGVVVIGLVTFGAYVAFCPTQKIWKHEVVAPKVEVADEGFKNATYQIDGTAVTLKDGVSEVAAAPGSASKIITKYFGNELRHDFNGDGTQDVAFLVTQETGGSGVFYYLVVALKVGTGYESAVNAILLGDRIAPQTTETGLANNVIVVNYADRKAGEPFTTQPSEGMSKWILLDSKTNKLSEVPGVGEPPISGAGSTNTSKMSLGMKKWTWVRTTFTNGSAVTPKDPSRFTLAFNSESVQIGTDCNSMGGQYEVSGNKITFTQMISTMMACQGSQEGVFAQEIGDIASYEFTSDGALSFDLKTGGGEMMFK